jgi:hypothetical protein
VDPPLLRVLEAFREALLDERAVHRDLRVSVIRFPCAHGDARPLAKRGGERHLILLRDFHERHGASGWKVKKWNAYAI